ncbi:MAG: glycosyltransferase family 9 protein [Akkermansiaceae bacterium]
MSGILESEVNVKDDLCHEVSVSPSLHLEVGALCVASPLDIAEACFSVPALRALKNFRPDSAIVVLCPESQSGIWQCMPELDGVICYPDKASARQISALVDAYELVFKSSILWELSESAKALKLSAIGQRLGYPATKLVKYLTDRVNVVVAPEAVSHRVRYYLNLVESLGADAYKPQNFITPIQPVSPPSGVLRIALAPESSYGEAYQWSVDRYVKVVNSMSSSEREIEWVIMHEPIEVIQKRGKAQSPCAVLHRECSDQAVEYTESAMGVSAALDLLKGCSALLASDGELAHLAAYLGLPAVVIFGPNESDWKRPLGKQSQVVRDHVACSPCFLQTCPIDHRCQNEVQVGDVIESLEKVLS